jgi:hypothetical protein
MPHDLSVYAFELPTVEEWISGDDRTLAFTVTDDEGDGVDISTATVSWALYDRPYEDDTADAVLTDSDSDVDLVTSGSVDPSVGEWEVDVGGAATADEWGEYHQRPKVEASDGTVATWRGTVLIEA